MASSYDLLHRGVQRWVRDQGWTELRQVQDRAIRAILSGDSDVLIAAATAAGKTEAAFLPLLGRAADRDAGGIAILYIAPLKALINDQARRLGGLCDDLGLPLVRITRSRHSLEDLFRDQDRGDDTADRRAAPSPTVPSPIARSPAGPSPAPPAGPPAPPPPPGNAS